MFKPRVNFDVADLQSDITYIGSRLRDYYCYYVYVICPTSFSAPIQHVHVQTSTFVLGY